MGLALADVRQQPAGSHRPAQAEAVQAVAVGAGKPRRAKQLLHHYRCAVELGAALVANQVEGFVHVPFVHQQQAPAAAQPQQKLGVQATDMEQRHRHQVGRRQAAGDYRLDTLGRTHGAERRLELQRGQCLANGPMAGQHALGPAGGARGIEDKRRVSRIDLDGRQRQQRPLDQLFETLAVGR